MEPNKPRLKLWADALGSGEYRQATGALRKRYWTNEDGSETGGFGYCCLGVACEVAVKNGLELDLSETYEEYATLPPEVADWYGIVDAVNAVDGLSPKFKVDGAGTMMYAVDLNDDLRVGFERIGRAVRDTYGLWNVDEEGFPE